MPKTKKMLSDWKAPYIQSLMKLFETQCKATLANWSVDFSRETSHHTRFKNVIKAMYISKLLITDQISKRGMKPDFSRILPQITIWK